MNKLIAIVGMAGSGKSIACDYLEEKGFSKIYFGGVILKKLEEASLEINSVNEKMMREKLRNDLGMAAVAITLLPDIKKSLEEGNTVLDGLYSWDEYLVLKKEFPNLKLLCINANKDIRYKRISERKVRPLTKEEVSKRDVSELENLAKGSPIAISDYFILNNLGMDEYVLQLDEFYKSFEKEV